ncbi:MAG: hypothetical protein AUH35_01330 [Nitrospirae bacterium 13_1_40CM_62_7]|nr:MAG: hypothetical protein AUH35_01330 [Nitrospirae bacterium 13_1_40CM_62_7]
MPQFRYRAARPDGTLVEERVDGESELAVRTQLEGQGLLLFSLDGPRSAAALLSTRKIGNRLSLREFLVFNQEFLALVKSGLPILKTFDLLAERGASISDAMARYPVYFSDLYRASLRSGEQTGTLGEVLQRYIAYVKLVIGVREKVFKALAYPAFLILVGVAVVVFLLIYVMPTFAEIYGQSNRELPAPTKMLLQTVATIRQWFPWLIAGTVGLGAAIYHWARTPAGREFLDRLSLRVPILGDVLLKSQVIRFARTLSTVLAGGIPLMSALQITGGAITNRIISRAIANATDRVRDGAGLAAALKQERFLPQMTLEMIEVGETTGGLEMMLRDVAEFHEGELDLRLSQLTTWIEPMLLLLMGIIVGGIVLIMYLPVFQIAGTA